MSERKKRLAALLLAAAVCVSGVPAGSVTAYAEGETADQGVEMYGENREADADGFELLEELGRCTLVKYTGNARKVVVPDGVTRILQNAFNGSNVTSITIPASVKEIHQYEGTPGDFRGAYELEEIIVDSQNPYLASEDGILYNKDKTRLYYYPFKKSGVLNIGADVEYISAYDISGCIGLTSVKVDAANPNFVFEDGVLRNKNNGSLIAVVPQPQGSINIPTTVTQIAEGALSNCDELISVNIPEGVTSIKCAAFQSCLKLTSVFIPESVKHIDSFVFVGSVHLTIYGKAGSYAETYAKDYEIPFSTGKPQQPEKPVTKTAQTLKVTKTYSKAYGSKPFKLNVKLQKGNGKLSYSGYDKKVVSVSKNGTVTIKGTGATKIKVTAAETAQYKKATAEILVKASPAKESLKSVQTLKGKKLKVSWKKDTRATGYQICYSTDKKFKNAKTTKNVTVKNNKTTTAVLKNLTKGKKYYVKIRAYKTANINKKTQKIYGAWSKEKLSGKIKK